MPVQIREELRADVKGCARMSPESAAVKLQEYIDQVKIGFGGPQESLTAIVDYADKLKELVISHELSLDEAQELLQFIVFRVNQEMKSTENTTISA